MQHWDITRWNTLISECLSLLQCFVIKRSIKLRAELFNVFTHIVVNFHLISRHGFQMQVNVGLRHGKIKSLGITWGLVFNIQIFFVNLTVRSAPLLGLLVNFCNFGLDFILTVGTCKDSCNFLVMLGSFRLWLFFSQVLSLIFIINILSSLFLIIFAKIWVDALEFFILTLTSCSQYFFNWFHMLNQNSSCGCLDKRRSLVIEDWGIEVLGILLLLGFFGASKLLLHSDERLAHGLFLLLLIVLSLELSKLLISLNLVFLVLLSLFGLELGNTD